MSFISAREHGAKVGSAGVASDQQQGIDRRERLRRLALETIDLAKDPYFMRNHLGQYECRLCLTLHTNEGNYLAHTQGKRHQQNLAKRAAREARDKPIQPAPKTAVAPRKTVKIGKPGYRVTKLYDPDARQRHLLFQIDYPEVQEGETPRHRFMSAFEQRKEAADRRYQYLMFAVEPYEVIAFKIPSLEVDRADGKFFSHWDEDAKVYSLSLAFKTGVPGMEGGKQMGGFAPPPLLVPTPPVAPPEAPPAAPAAMAARPPMPPPVAGGVRPPVPPPAPPQMPPPGGGMPPPPRPPLPAPPGMPPRPPMAAPPALPPAGGPPPPPVPQARPPVTVPVPPAPPPAPPA